MPSPAQSATEGWITLRCASDSRAEQLTSCICGLLRLGVKQIQHVDAKFFNAQPQWPVERECCRLRSVGLMHTQLNQREMTGYAGAGRSGIKCIIRHFSLNATKLDGKLFSLIEL